MTAQDPIVNVRAALEAAGVHYMNLIEFGILKVFIDFHVFDHIPDQGDIAIEELAVKVNGDESLIRRFSDYLVTSEVLASPAPGRLSHTTRSLSYRSSEIAAGFVTHVYHFFLRPMAAWTSYFEKNGLSEPKDANTIPLGHATGHPDADLYGVLDKEPELAHLFNVAQTRSAAIYPIKDVYDFAWVREALRTQSGNDRPAIVDIGGSHGLALKEILNDNTFIPPERCAVLDLPNAVEQAQSSLHEDLRNVHFIGGSMLKPFPEAIQGAAIYQFRRVLSDFVDKDIVLALKQARDVCASDSRVLLIEELVKPTRGKFAIAQDISVFNFGGKRRSELDWRRLAEQAGFKLNDVFEHAGSEFAVLQLIPA
ncbi:Nn.00g074810.m01.CDS01 [Neocucurbitaria sp. VM-36]